jgi:penicillin-binding protein 1A
MSQPKIPNDTLHTAGAARQLIAALATDLRLLRPSSRIVRFLAKSTLAGVMLLTFAFTLVMLWALYRMPLDKRPGIDGPSVLVEAANGETVGRVGPLSELKRRQDFPEQLIKAVLSIEDRRFFSHWGVDPWGVARAAYANWAAGGIVEGGSTITQQLVKMKFVGRERSLERKLREAFTAAWLDFRLGKDEILTRYLNSVYLGAGAYGMSAGARLYFDKTLPELTLAESAMLAGLIQAPSRNDPIRNLTAAQGRAGVVLDAMREANFIDAKVADEGKAMPATLKLSVSTALAGSWFADWIAKYELPKISGSPGRTIRVRSTLEPEIQKAAERVVNEALTRSGEAQGASQAALVAMRMDGAVIAMVGGRNYDESQFNRAVEAQRQPGSTFKLFVYYAALRNGFLTDTTIDASPIEIGRWRPENYGGQQFGQMTLTQAFAQSVNTAAVRLAMTVGLDKVVVAARDLGLRAPLKQVPSMALGANELTLLDLTGTLASIRAGRMRLEPWGISAFSPDGGALRSLGPPSPQGELPQRDELSRLLKAVVESGTGRAAAVDGQAVAGKTGTSQDHRDAWFVGFANDLVVGVWVGNDDRTPMKGMTGGALPAQLWRQFVTAAAPLVGRAKEPDATARIPSATPTASPQCDQAACASRYNSFQSSDCTYQPYAGPRRLCELPQRSAADQSRQPAAAEGQTGDGQPNVAENTPNTRHSRRSSRGRPGAQPPPIYGYEAPAGPFGPSMFRQLDRLGF